MAATSLARQLAALRTPGTEARRVDAVYSGPFLFPEAEALPSLAALREAVGEAMALLYSHDSGLARYSVLLEAEPGDGEVEELVEDCVIRLCPHLLLRPAQLLLQWLVTRHKVHISHPEVLVFSVLPHHTYSIYQAVLSSLPPATVASLPWLAKFLQTAVPTTPPTLHRQVATSPAFLRFLCSQLSLLSSHLARCPDTRVHRQATLAMAALLGGLQLCGEVGEERLHHLLAAVLAGFRSSSEELGGLSSILLAAILPRVTLQPKAVARVTKAIAKFARKEVAEDTLYLVLVLARTQACEAARLVELVVKHQSVINALLNSVQAGAEEEVVEQVDGVVYSLAVVAEGLVVGEGEERVAATMEELALLGLLASSTAATSLSPETAERVAEVVVRLTASLGKDDGQLKAFKKELGEVRANLERLNPDSCRAWFVEAGRGDVVFVPGHADPSQAQVEVAAILATDPLVSFLSSKPLIKCTDQKVLRKVLRKNLAPLVKMLEAPTAFLLTQVERARLEVLLLNLLRSAWGVEELHTPLLRHLCSLELHSSELQEVVEVLVLPFLLTSTPATVQEVLGSHLASTSPLLSILSSLSPSSSMYQRALTQKLSLALLPSHLERVVASPSLHHPALLALLLRLAPLLLGRPEHAWGPTLATLLTTALTSITVSWEKVEKEEDNVALVGRAGQEGKVPWCALALALSSLKEESEELLVMGEVVRLLVPLHEQGRGEEVAQVVEHVMEVTGHRFLAFLLATALAADPKLSFVCLQEAAAFTATLGPKQLQQQGAAPLAPHLLHLALSPQTRVQRQAYRLLPHLATTSDLQPVLKALIDFFINHKTEIINNVDNFGPILQKGGVEEGASRALLELCLAAPALTFPRLAPLFEQLASKKSAELLCRLGLAFLARGDASSTAALATLVSRLAGVVAAHLSLPLAWTFLEACLASPLTVEVAGITKSLPRHLLATLAASPAVASVGEEHATTLLSTLAQYAATSAPHEASRLAAAAKTPPAAVLAQLTRLWGQQVLAGARGKQVEQGVWTATAWLVETLELLLEQPGDWRALVKPVFVLVRRAADMEVEEGTYRLSLLLSVLLKLVAGVADSALRSMSGEVEPEVLVTCIRTSPNPDTRQTALRILARCALANPDFILHNSITIFTFMGSHLLKVDSRRSFQVACEALEVLVPAMKAACEAPGRQGRLAGSCLGVLTTFVDSSKDIPTHRLAEFLVRLVACLGAADYLWVAALLLARKERRGGERSVTELFCRFEPGQAVEALLRLLVNTRADTQQLRKMFGVEVDRKEEEEKPDDWDVLRLRALQLTNSILGDKLFKAHVGTCLQGEQDDTMEMVNLLVEATILTIQHYTALAVPMPPRLKRNLVVQSEKTLELSLSLLPSTRFLQLASLLLTSPTASVRLRALEVVSVKLAPPCALPPDALPALLSPLVQLAVTEEHPHTQQLALLAVRQLAKHLADPSLLAEAAAAFTPAFMDGISNPKVLGAAVLSCGDVLASLGPRAVTRLPATVTWLLGRLEAEQEDKDWAEKEVAVVRNSFLYCLQKLVESFVGFLHPLLSRTISLACRLAGVEGATTQRAAALLSCLAAAVPPHTVLAGATQLLEQVWLRPAAVAPFVNFVAESCRRLERHQLTAVSKEMVALFTAALGYRAARGAEEEKGVVGEVEQAVITAFLSVALRLSLEDFKPVYQRLVATHQDGSTDQLVTLFHLTTRVAEKLRSLFSFGVETTAVLVTATFAVERPEVLATAALNSLATLLAYNKVETGVLSIVQHERLVTALLGDWVLPCAALPAALGQLAAASTDDTSWKFLHYQLLLALRDARPAVRLAVLEVLHAAVTDRGDTYMPVLPDAVPFLQEILEDDDQAVEARCRTFIQHMEETFGQNIESYFQ